MYNKSLIYICLFALFTSNSIIAADSTQVHPVVGKPAIARAIVQDNTNNNCVASPQFKIWLGTIAGHQLDYKNWKNFQCPAGYLPYGLEKLANTIAGNGTLEFRYYCCKTVVRYD